MFVTIRLQFMRLCKNHLLNLHLYIRRAPPPCPCHKIWRSDMGKKCLITNRLDRHSVKRLFEDNSIASFDFDGPPMLWFDV